MRLSKTASRLRMAALPFQWIARGCFEWDAAFVAWRLALSRRARDAD